MTIAVCFVSPGAYPLFDPKVKQSFGGGSELQSYLYSRTIAKDSHYSVSFIVGDYGQPRDCVIDKVAIYKVRGLIPGASQAWSNRLRLVRRMWQLLNEINADIYQIRAAGPEVGVVALFCRLRHKKFVYMTASDIDVDGRYTRTNGLAGRVYQFGLRCADLVIYQTEDHRRRLGLPGPIIGNAMDVPRVKVDHSRKNLIWIGTMQPLKQPDILLKLAKDLPDKQFIMIAPLHHPQHQELFDRIELQARQISNLQFIAGVPFAESWEYFRGAKALINTSTYEGFPNTMIQAFACGTPVVTLGVDPGGVITGNRLGAVNKDYAALKRAINSLSDDSCREISERAKSYFARHHRLEVNANHLKSEYIQLVGNGKIVIVAPYAASLFGGSREKFGGAEVQMSLIAKELATLRRPVTMIVGSSRPGRDIREGYLKVLEAINLSSGFVSRALRYWKLIGSERPEVIFTSSFSVDVGLLALIARLCHTKFVYRIASSIEANGGSSKKDQLAGFIYDRGLRAANAIVTQHKEIADDLKACYGLSSTIIPNAYPVPDRISERRKYILWVGSARQLKHPEIFVALARAIPSQKFCMIMPIEDLRRPQWVQRIVSDAKSIKNLEFIPGVPFANIDEYFKSAKLLVNTSDYEGFANVFVQACAWGVPIVSWKIDPDQFIISNKLGYVGDETTAILVQQVIKLVNDPDLWHQMSERAHSYASANHNIKRIAVRYRQLFDEVMMTNKRTSNSFKERNG